MKHNYITVKQGSRVAAFGARVNIKNSCFGREFHPTFDAAL